MDSGELDFYDHTEQCTGRCVSRSTVTSKLDSMVSSVKDESLSDLSLLDANTANLDEHAYTVLRQVQGGNVSPVPEISVSRVGSLLTAKTHALQKITTIPQAVIKKEPNDSDDNTLDLDSMVQKAEVNNGIYIISPAMATSSTKTSRSKYDVAVGPRGETDFDHLADSFPNIEDFLDGNCGIL